MRVVKVVPFEFEGGQYETRVTFDGEVYRVATYKDGRQVNPFAHLIEPETAADLNTSTALDYLIQKSIEIVENKVWERLKELDTGSAK